MTGKKIGFFVLMMLFTMSSALSAQSSFKIVVNSTNPISSIPRVEAQRYFLKKATRWEDGTQVKPIDLKADSPAREKFTKDVLNKTVSAVKSYWQGQIFSGAGIPPKEVTSDQAVLEWISSNSGGIGYIA